MLLEQLLKGGAVKGEVVALDGTAIKAYSQRRLDNKTGKSDSIYIDWNINRPEA
jgi:hypothetical protein